MDIISIFTSPLQYGFMQRALIEVMLIGALTATIGVFVVVRNLAFLGEAVSHGVFPGIIVAFITKVNLFIGALTTALLTVAGISFLSRGKRLSTNTATGVIFTTMLAGGVVMISSLSNYRTDLANLLLGDILAVNWGDIALSLAVLVVTWLLLLVNFRRFILSSFDRTFAKAGGINVDRWDFITYILIALVIVAAIPAVGNLLVVALSIIPAASARLLTKRLGNMLIISIITGITVSVIGLYLSYYLSVASGAFIVLLHAAWLGLVFVATKKNS